MTRTRSSDIWKGWHRASGQAVAIKIVSVSRSASSVETEVAAVLRVGFSPFPLASSSSSTARSPHNDTTTTTLVSVSANTAASTPTSPSASTSGSTSASASATNDEHHRHLMCYFEHFMCNGEYWLIMEWGSGGDLYAELESRGFRPFSEDEARTRFVQVLQGLQFLHSIGIAHRDIKPDNLVYDRSGALCIVDLGLASLDKHCGRSSAPVGTKQYRAPEVQQCAGYSPQLADMYSTGVVLFALVTGRTPYGEPLMSDAGYTALLSQQRRDQWLTASVGKRRSSPSPQLLHLLSALLRPENQGRWDLDRVLVHPWVVGTVQKHEAVARVV